MLLLHWSDAVTTYGEDSTVELRAMIDEGLRIGERLFGEDWRQGMGEAIRAQREDRLAYMARHIWRYG